MKIIKIIGEIGSDTTVEQLNAKLDASSGDISITIESPGGGVFEGISMHNSIRAYNSGKVTIIVASICASIASYIALAGDVIEVHDNSAYMIHNAHVGMRGDAKDFANTSKTLKGVNDVMLAAYHQKTNMSKEKISNLMDNETYFFGEDIVTYGFADKVIDTGLKASAEEISILAEEKVTLCNANCKNRVEENIKKVAALLYKEVPSTALAIEAKKIMEQIK